MCCYLPGTESQLQTERWTPCSTLLVWRRKHTKKRFYYYYFYSFSSSGSYGVEWTEWTYFHYFFNLTVVRFSLNVIRILQEVLFWAFLCGKTEFLHFPSTGTATKEPARQKSSICKWTVFFPERGCIMKKKARPAYLCSKFHTKELKVLYKGMKMRRSLKRRLNE